MNLNNYLTDMDKGNKTHWKKLKNPNYIGAYELLDGSTNPELTVKITKVVKEIVKDTSGNGQECTVAYLEGQKPLILNTTNSKIIEAIYKSPYIEDWAGKSITLIVKKVKAFGDEVDAIRIKQSKPVASKKELKPGMPEWEQAVQYMATNGQIEAITKKYILSETNREQLLNEAI